VKRCTYLQVASELGKKSQSCFSKFDWLQSALAQEIPPKEERVREKHLKPKSCNVRNIHAHISTNRLKHMQRTIGTKGDGLMDSTTHNVITSRDVLFTEYELQCHQGSDNTAKEMTTILIDEKTWFVG